MNFREFVTGKPISARSRLIQHWRTLRPDLPIIIEPISKDHKGSTRNEDGLRITGSPRFIASVIAKLKTILLYENDKTKIEILYRQTGSHQGVSQSPTYVMYINIKERGSSTI